MAVIKNVSISWVKCDQDHPDMGYDGESPSWKLNIDSPSDELVTYWKEHNLGGLKTEKDTKKPYIVIQRKATPFANGDAKEAPSVVDGHLKPLDPNTIGNGSIANVQFSLYDWKFKNRKGVAADLMGIQVVNLVPREGANGAMEFEMIDPEGMDSIPFTPDQDAKDIY